MRESEIVQKEELKREKATSHIMFQIKSVKTVKHKFCLKKTTKLTIIASNFVREQLITTNKKYAKIHLIEDNGISELVLKPFFENLTQ